MTEPAGGGAPRFPVDVPGFQGELADLVVQANRGELDLAALPVARITAEFRSRLTSDPSVDSRDVADFLVLAGRLLSLKAQRLLPDSTIDGHPAEPEDDAAGAPDPGARLAEYRLYSAAAEALLAGPSEEGVRSFAGTIAATVEQVERLRIPPERLAAAFQRILERLPEPAGVEPGGRTYSVEEKLAEIRALLAERPRIAFDDVFAAVASRLEAVACFLALLELVRLGEATVEQAGAFDAIEVRRLGGGRSRG
ncbi:MAG TPA: ScpA family protein [Candidatus Dormibacteraeota bacterium]|nr:ScpA family protein [Candidatus Dormibacteraeota bacterium]